MDFPNSLCQLRTSVATCGIFSATSSLFKCFKNSFYSSTGILNQAKHIRCDKFSLYPSLPVTASILEYSATACTSLALDLAVRLIMCGGIEIVGISASLSLSQAYDNYFALLQDTYFREQSIGFSLLHYRYKRSWDC